MNKKQYYLEHREVILERAKKWNKEHYQKHPRTKKSRKLYDAKYRLKNLEKRKLYNHAWRAKKKETGKITEREWLDLLDKYGRKCLCCGATENIELDHVVPLSKGGCNTINNAQPLCKSCNSRKKNTIKDYRIM